MKKFGTPTGAAPGNAKLNVGFAGVGAADAGAGRLLAVGRFLGRTRAGVSVARVFPTRFEAGRRANVLPRRDAGSEAVGGRGLPGSLPAGGENPGARPETPTIGVEIEGTGRRSSGKPAGIGIVLVRPSTVTVTDGEPLEDANAAIDSAASNDDVAPRTVKSRHVRR
jgi:hypothetical protein